MGRGRACGFGFGNCHVLFSPLGCQLIKRNKSSTSPQRDLSSVSSLAGACRGGGPGWVGQGRRLSQTTVGLIQFGCMQFVLLAGWQC